MKLSAGQARRICLEAVHQLGRIALLLFMLVLTALGLFAYSLSRHPMEIPHLASWLATTASGDGITVHMERAELAWEGYHQGGSVPLVLRISDIDVRSAAGALLVEIPKADLVVPPIDIFGGQNAILLRASKAQLSGSTAPVTVRANIWPGSGYTLARGTFFVSVGAGMLGITSAGVPVSSASLTMQTAPGAVDITDGTATLAPIGGSAPHAAFSFSARRDKRWTSVMHATVDAVRAEELAQYWPAPTLRLTRAWVIKNITSGTASNADFTFNLTAPGDLSGLDLTNATGGFDGTGLTLRYLKGFTPITGLNGHFALLNADETMITASAGQVGKVSIRQGQMDIIGLNHKDQTGQLKIDLAGALPDVLHELNAPPLAVLSKAPKLLATATGQVEGTLSLTIPFERNLEFSEVKLGVTASVHNMTMASPMPPLAARKGEVRVQTDGHSLHVQAKAEFAGEPASLALVKNLEGDGRLELTLKGAAGPQMWHFLGLDSTTEMNTPAGGTAPFTFTIAGPGDGVQTGVLHADLTNVALAAPVFGWAKKAGDAGDFELSAQLSNGTFKSAQSFSAHAPGLVVDGVQHGDALAFSAADIGRTQATGTLSWPASANASWVADFSGPVLDLRQPKQSPRPAGTAQPSTAPTPAAAAPPSGPGWTARLKFAQLYVAPSPAPALSSFALEAQGRGATLLQAQGSADGLSLSVTPQTDNTRAVALHAADTGTLLRALGQYQHLQGGALELRASFGGGRPITGKGSLAHARFVDAPDMTKFLQGLTLYGLAAATSGPGLMISHAEIPFSLQDDVLMLHGARAYSSSLGFTASGSIDLANNSCDLDTTIVPLYALNALPGKIPLIGRLFSPEKGGGLLAMRAHISGPIGHVDVHINPLSALTPGFLRSIFGIGEEMEK
jgi:Protein of unknown function/AsmA-like C-terminal region